MENPVDRFVFSLRSVAIFLYYSSRSKYFYDKRTVLFKVEEQKICQ